jgi:hypothetical protein
LRAGVRVTRSPVPALVVRHPRGPARHAVRIEIENSDEIEIVSDEMHELKTWLANMRPPRARRSRTQT